MFVNTILVIIANLKFYVSCYVLRVTVGKHKFFRMIHKFL